MLTLFLSIFGALVASVMLSRTAGTSPAARAAGTILWPCYLLVVLLAWPLAMLEHFLETRLLPTEDADVG